MANFFRRFFSLPYFPIILAPVILFSSTLFTGRVLFWGLPALQFIPWREFAWGSLQNGVLPLWNPFNGLGAPLIANYQLALFYPPGWLVYVFAAIGGTQWMAWSHSLLVVLHLVWAGIGMVFFVRSLGLGILAQTISGLAFSLCGYLVARNNFFSIVWAAAWLPWILYAVNEIANRPRIQFSFKLLAFASLQLLAGHAQVTWYTLLLAFCWLVIVSWARYGWRRGFASAVLFLGIMACSAALTSIQLLPTAEFLLQSQRSTAVDYELGLTYSFWPWRLLTLFSANFFGNPGSGDYLGYATYWEDAVYIGVIPFILALTSIKKIFPQKKTGDSPMNLYARILWGLILAGFILALGKNTPIFPFLYQYVPTFGMFNAPARWMIWAVFGLCVLAGIGAETWSPPVGKARRRNRVYLVVAAAIAIGAGVTWLALKDVRVTFIAATAAAGAWAFVFCLITVLSKRPVSSSARLGYLLSGLIALDLILNQWPLIVTAPASIYSPGAPAVSLQADQRVYLAYSDEYTLKFQRFFRIEDFNPVEDWSNIWKTLLPDTNLMAKVPYFNDFDPLLAERYANVVQYLDKQPPEARSGLLRLFNIGAVETLDPSSPDGVQFTTQQGAGRFQWESCAVVAENENDAWQKILDLAQQETQDEIVIEDAGNVSPCVAGKQAAIDVVKDTTQEVTIDINAETDGWLVMVDTWYPGWQATIDGTPVNIYRADYLLRAIPVDAGQHEITFAYKPLSFVAGAVVTVASLIALAAVGLFFAIRRKFRNKL